MPPKNASEVEVRKIAVRVWWRFIFKFFVWENFCWFEKIVSKSDYRLNEMTRQLRLVNRYELDLQFEWFLKDRYVERHPNSIRDLFGKDLDSESHSIDYTDNLHLPNDQFVFHVFSWCIRFLSCVIRAKVSCVDWMRWICTLTISKRHCCLHKMSFSLDIVDA